MKFLRILPVKKPTRGTNVAAGIDFFVPECTKEFIEMFKEKNPNIELRIEYNRIYDDGIIVVGPHERVNIPSGVKVEVPHGYALIAYNKSGVSLKYGLDIGASVVDEDYKGQIHLSLVNTSDDIVYIKTGQKIVQFILLPVNYEMPEEVDSEEKLFTRESQRGEGCFGSTGEK